MVRHLFSAKSPRDGEAIFQAKSPDGEANFHAKVPDGEACSARHRSRSVLPRRGAKGSRAISPRRDVKRQRTSPPAEDEKFQEKMGHVRQLVLSRMLLQLKYL